MSMVKHEKKKTMRAACELCPPFHRIYSLRDLGTQTVQAEAFALTFEHDHELEGDWAELSPYEPLPSSFSHTRQSYTSSASSHRSFTSGVLWSPHLCTNASLLEHFRTTHREERLVKGHGQIGQGSPAIRGTFPERLRVLWITLESEIRRVRKRRALYDLSLTDLVDTHGTGANVDQDDVSKNQSKGGLDLTAQIGTLVFFRLLESLRCGRNKRGILKLIRQIPCMIVDTPVLALLAQPDKSEHMEKGLPMENSRPFAGPAAGLHPGGVVEAILSAAEELMFDGHKLSGEEQGDLLAAMVGLAIKRGSINISLQVLQLLMFGDSSSDRPVVLHGVGFYLKELQAIEPCGRLCADLRSGDGGGFYNAIANGTVVSTDGQDGEAGSLLSLFHRWKHATNEIQSNGSDITASVPDILRGVGLTKVHSTAFYHAVLAVDGKLLVWKRHDNFTSEDGRSVVEAGTSPLLLDTSHDVSIWRPRDQGRYSSPQGIKGCACTGYHPSTGFLNNGKAGGEPNRGGIPVVMQFLAGKPAVTDIACGVGHTLALLATGQVFSWGNGANGRLGLGDTRDQAAATCVIKLQGIDIVNVFCGVSHSLAVSATGVAYSWGKNSSGQCGNADPTLSDQLSPRLIEGLMNLEVAVMAGGWGHTLILTRCRQVFSFGAGYKDERTGEITPVLGISAAAKPTDREERGLCLPTKISEGDLGSDPIKAIASGWDHCMAITNDGSLLTWGTGSSGQLGHGDTEARDLPARVAFFSTPSGGRVYSAAAGRHYTAAVTEDGRLFAWGSQHRCQRRHSGDDEGGGDSSHDKDTISAIKITSPRLMETDGNDSRWIGLGQGDTFDLVLTQLSPTKETSSAAAGAGSGAGGILAGTGLVAPDNPLQPIGRLEVAVSLLRHFERLAIHHVPTNPTAEVDHKVQKAMFARENTAVRAAHNSTDFAANGSIADSLAPPHCGESTTTKDQYHFGEKPGTSSDAELQTSSHLEMETTQVDKRNTPGSLSHVRPSLSPFCVDTSPQSFHSFLRLLRDIRTARGFTRNHTADKQSPFTGGNRVRPPTHGRKVNTHAGPKGILMQVCPNVAGRVDEVGPESPPCGQSSPSGCPGADGVVKGPSNAEGPPMADRSVLTMASPVVQLEVLRCTLRLLRINLFYFIRSASIHRAYCGIDNINRTPTLKGRYMEPSVVAAETMPTDADRGGSASQEGVGHADGTIPGRENGDWTIHVQGGPEAWCPPPSQISDRSTRVGEPRDLSSMEGSSEEASTELQGEISECFGHRGHESQGDRARGIHMVMKNIQYELCRLLDEEVEVHSPEIAGAIEAVQAEVAESFRVGFGLFYPCNKARVQLLRDIVDGIASSDSSSLCRRPHIQDNGNIGRTLTGREPDSDQFRLTARLNPILLKAAIEGLTRDNYAAAMVAEALDAEGVFLKREGRVRPECESLERWPGGWTAEGAFNAMELDGIMRSLLVHCTNDLTGRLCDSDTGVRIPANSCCRRGKTTGESVKNAKMATCSHVKLLLTLQTHVIGCWGDLESTILRPGTAGELAVAHAIRLFEANLEVFTRLFEEENVRDPGPSALDHEAVRRSFLSMVPLLCVSITALPVPREGRASLAIALLPALLPMIGVVDRFNRLQETVEDNIDELLCPRSSESGSSFACWMRGLEETLAVLSADLVCGLIENGAIKTHAPLVQLPCAASDGRRDGEGISTDHDRTDDRDERLVELMLTSSPFLEHGRECFNRPSGEFGPGSPLNSSAFGDARKVIAWAEKIAVERRSSSRPNSTPFSGPGSSTTSPSRGRPIVQHNLLHRRRRASGDRSEKLNPIDPSAPVTSNSSQTFLSDTQRRCSDSMGRQGDDSTTNDLQGSVGAGRAVESTESARATLTAGACGRNGNAMIGRQLNSMVDESCAEGFIQDLLCGQGPAQALYLWMAAPPVSQLPVLHATSLATQGHGWGSYQSLCSHTCSTSGSDDKRSAGALRRRRFGALSLDVDAAARALIGVMIKSNGLVTEAATFAKCRLDQASSAPPALKLIVAAVAEVREVLTGLANSSTVVQDTTNTAGNHGYSTQANSGEEGDHGPDLIKDQSATAKTLSAIVRNCGFLLKCPRLPVVSLSRPRCQEHISSSCRQKRSSSRLPSDKQQMDQDLARILRGWATDAKNNMEPIRQRCESIPNQTLTKSLALICEQMTRGQVEIALSTAAAAEKEMNLWGCASLESLMAFAASPIAFDALELGMMTHELRARVRATGFQLARYLVEDVQISVARRHIGERLARALGSAPLDVHTSSSLVHRLALFGDISGAGWGATDLVHSAFVDLCSYTVCEMRDRRSARDTRVPRPTTCSGLIVLLTLLRNLVGKLSPSLLRYIGGINGSEQTSAAGRAEGKSASSTSRHKRIPTVPGSAWSSRLGSCKAKSIAAVEENSISAASLAEHGVVSVIAAALPVLGAVLGDEGDVLTQSAWGPGAATRHTNIHRTAWRTLCVLSGHICWAPVSVRLSERDVSLGQSTSSSTDHVKQVATGGVQQWWQIVQALLSVLFNELTRAKEQLEAILHSQETEQVVMIATRAQRLTSGPTRVPLPAVSTFPHWFQDEESGAFAVTFWAWIDQSTRELCLRKRPLPVKDNVPTAVTRMVIFSHVRKALSVGGCMEHSEVALSRPPPHHQHQNSRSHKDEDHVYVEFTFKRHTGDASLPRAAGVGQNGVHGTPTWSASTRSTSADELPPDCITPQDPADRSIPGVVMERLSSAFPLPVGCWTHVCCSYSEKENNGDSSECGVVRITFSGHIVAKQDLSGHSIDSKKQRTQCSPGVRERVELRVGEGCWTTKPINPVDKVQTSPIVCDIHWHAREVSPEQVHSLASNGIPQQREDEQLTAECYVDRIVRLALKLALSSQRTAATISSSRWLALWLAVVPITSLHTQRVVLRLLRLLLCTEHPSDGDKMETVSLDGVATVTSSFGLGAPVRELDDRVVICRLCALLGKSLLALHDYKPGLYFGRRPNEPGKLVLNRDRETFTRTRRITTVPLPCQETSTVSQIVALLRALVLETPTRWRPHVHATLVDGLAMVDTGALTDHSSSIPKCKTPEEVAETDVRSATMLGAAAAAVYLGGGHIEGPRVGARVSLVLRDYPSVGRFNTVNSTPVTGPTDQVDVNTSGACTNGSLAGGGISVDNISVKRIRRGIALGMSNCDASTADQPGAIVTVVIDEECHGRINEIDVDKYAVHASTTLPDSRVVTASYRQVIWEAEIEEPTTPFLVEGAALPVVRALLMSCTGRSACPDMSISKPEVDRADCVNSSGRNIFVAHLRSRLVRALAVQLRHPDLAATAVQGDLLNPLLSLSSVPLQSTPILALGVNSAVDFGRRYDFAAIVLCLDQQRVANSSRSLLADLQTACQTVWARINMNAVGRASHIPCRETSKVCMKREDVDSFGGNDDISASTQPSLQILGGEAQVEDDRVTAVSHFPTIRLSGVGAGLRSAGGRWYYEVTLLTGGLMQLGWAAAPFQCSPIRGQGVGDHMHSWAFDGFRQKRWCISSAPYGKRWRAGDVVGALLDAELQEMRFSLNGHDLGVAFVGFDPEGLYPAASMNVGQKATFNFGTSPFVYAPAHAEEIPFRPITEAGAIKSAAGRDPYADLGLPALEAPSNLAHMRSLETSSAENRAQGQFGNVTNQRLMDLSSTEGSGTNNGGHDARARSRSIGPRSGCNTSDTTENVGTEGEAVHAELRRQGLVENLIGMGFPVEWAIRAAESSAGTVMSETAATAWIIEHLEIENAKMEEEMGSMETCEDDFVGIVSGGGNEYNEESQANGDAGFAYVGESGGTEGSDPRSTRRIIGDTRGNWRDMYRQRFISRSNGDSPATASSLQVGQIQGVGAALNNAAASSVAASASEGTGATTRTWFQSRASRELLRVVLSADEEDLACLSLVLEMALSILFARAAVVNLLTHVRVSLSPLDECYPHPSLHMLAGGPGHILPCWSTSMWRKMGYGQSIASRSADLLPPIMSYPRGDHTMGSAMSRRLAVTVAQRVIEALARPDCQRKFIDLTKVFITWPCVSQSLSPYNSTSLSAETLDNVLVGGTEALQDLLDESTLGSTNAADLIGLFGGSCVLVMRSLFQLAVGDGQALARSGRDPLESPFSKKSPNERPPTIPRLDDDIDRTALPSFLTLAIEEAVENFEYYSHMGTSESGAVHPATSIEASGSRCRQSPPQRSALWAMWVLETVMTLEERHRDTDHSSFGGTAEEKFCIESTQPPNRSKRYDVSRNGDCHMMPLSVAVGAARSSRAFTAVLLSTSSRLLNVKLRCLAYSLCAKILNRSLSAAAVCKFNPQRQSEAGVPGEQATTTKHHDGGHAQSQDEYFLPSQERALAREFSAQVRNGISTRNLSSPLLKSQLELLAQWLRRRQTVGGEAKTEKFRISEYAWAVTELHPGAYFPFPLETSIYTYQELENCDVATSVVAGRSNGGDGFEAGQPTRTQIGGPRRPRTAESEPSALLTMPESSSPVKAGVMGLMPMLVETVTATSVTLSWGDWQDDDHPSELFKEIDGDDVMGKTQTSHGKRASTLVQALRAKARFAGSRRHGLGLALKVAALGLWGSEPTRIVAVGLEHCDCFTVHGLAPDTHYSFRLEKHALPGDPSIAFASEFGEHSDDDRSCFPPATVGHEGSSTGGSSAGPPETDTADGASSALTGPEVSQGSGGSSAYSEGGTDIQTDDGRANGKTSLTSSTRAVAGHNRRTLPSETQGYALDGESWVWHSAGSRKQSYDISEDPIETVGGEWVLTAAIFVATRPAVPFMLDAESCGPNLRLSNSNLTVTNCGRKKWNAVRTMLGFSSGVHSWKVRIDRCVSKNVFVGVISSESKLNNYVGSDKSGWGYLANKAIWHNKGKVRSYGDLFREGDTIGVNLNMDLGTLRFSRNGRDLGVAVQGLEGTLYPAFSMYNRNDQLTLLPPDAHGTPIEHAAGGNGGAASSEREADALQMDCAALHGTFSAECVIRRAAKSLEVLEILTEPQEFESLRGRKLVEIIMAGLDQRMAGHHQRSLPSSHACTPVRLDVSERARRDFLGLGTGDRVVSADGEATVIGASRHSLWVSLEMSASSPVSTTGLGQGADASSVDVEDRQQYNDTDRLHGINTPVESDTTPKSMVSPAGVSGLKKSKILPLSRRTVRQITTRPEEYVISRGVALMGAQRSANVPTANAHDGVGFGTRRDEDGTTAAECKAKSITEFQQLFSRWTPAMDHETRQYLERASDSFARGCSLDVPSEALRNISSTCADTFALIRNLSSAEVRARAALLLHVNDLVIPLLPLLDPSAGGCGPLGALVRKNRHLLFTEAKSSLLRILTGPTVETPISESASDDAPGYTLFLKGIKSLPNTAADVGAYFAKLSMSSNEMDPPEVSSADLCWVQRGNELERSVFGQMAKQLSSSPLQSFDEHMAFSVNLEGGPAENGDDSHDQSLDEYGLYQGVFWQVCRDICSPPIAMFVSKPGCSMMDAPAATRRGVDDRRGENSRGTTIPWLDDGVVPDPLFIFNRELPTIYVDPTRLEYYHSLGFVAGLAVRSRVPLPLPRLAPRWWMLVAEEEHASAGSVSNDMAATARIVTATATRSGSSENRAASSSVSEESRRPTSSTVDGVLASLGRLQEGSTALPERLYEILADARFVGPLSNRQIVELSPGGVDRPVTSNNVSEYCSRLAVIGASQYVPQASAFRMGLEAVLPRAVLSLLTWTEMELMICGDGKDH